MGAPTTKRSTCEFCQAQCEWKKNEGGQIYLPYLWVHTGSGDVFCEPGTENPNRVKPVDFCIERIRANELTREFCNRPVVHAEYGTCGIHMKFERERRERDEKEEFKKQMRQYVKAMVDPIVERWNAYYDLDAHPEESRYRGSGEYSGYVSVNPGRLNDLLQKIEEEL